MFHVKHFLLKTPFLLARVYKYQDTRGKKIRDSMQKNLVPNFLCLR